MMRVPLALEGAMPHRLWLQNVAGCRIKGRESPTLFFRFSSSSRFRLGPRSSIPIRFFFSQYVLSLPIMKNEAKTVVQVRVEQQSDTERSGPQTDTEKRDIIVASDESDVVPHLHAKTFLAIFAVALIYFTQVFNVVGAGSVRNS